MKLYTRLLVFVFVICLSSEDIRSEKSDSNNNGDQDKSIFAKLKEYLADFKIGNVKLPDRLRMRRLLQISKTIPFSFEEIERRYQIGVAIKYLDEFIGYAVRVNNDTETRSHLEEVRRQQIQRLTHMTLTEIRTYITTLKRTMQQSSNTNNHDHITINGHTYSMNRISDWCCNFGG